jgi:hypothetical protein
MALFGKKDKKKIDVDRLVEESQEQNGDSSVIEMNVKELPKIKEESKEEAIAIKKRSEIIQYYMDNYPGGIHNPASFGLEGSTISDLLLAVIFELKKNRQELEALNTKISDLIETAKNG